MLNWIVSIFIFCLVLFIYLHIYFHIKTSNDLEIYEIEDVSKEKFEELCDIRQPILFTFDNEKILEYTSYDYIYSQYGSFDIQIRESAYKKKSNNEKKDNDIKESDKKNSDINKNTDTDVYVPLSLNLTNKLFIEDDTETYYTANNSDFIKETGVIKSFQYNDEFLRPYMLCNTQYDIMSGSDNTVTPFKYELNYRNFFLVTQGSIEIKMAPPKSHKYLHPVKDYELFEFKSPINPWNVSPEYKADFDKIKCLEFTVTKGKALYIPAYWWYSIKFNNDASITCFRYRTYMNNIAILPYIGMHALQIQNVKRNVVKKASISQLNHEIVVPLENTEVDVDLSNAELNNVSIVNSTLDNNFESGTSINELPDVVDSNI